jgi:hypothetical protein
MRVVIVLAADEEGIVVFGILSLGFAGGFVVISEDKMDGLPSVIEVF